MIMFHNHFHGKFILIGWKYAASREVKVSILSEIKKKSESILEKPGTPMALCVASSFIRVADSCRTF